MRVVVDYEACEGNGRCADAAPEVFALGEDADQTRVIDERPAEELREKVERALRWCPKGAISLVED